MRGLALLLLAVALAPASAPAVNPLDPAAAAFLDTPLDSLERLAVEAYQAGDHAEAARRYLAALERDITNATAVYNLACCYGLLGEPELAARNLTRAFRAGFRDIEHARRDPDFDLVRASLPFGAVIDSLARVEATGRPGSVLPVRSSTYLPCTVILPPGYDSTRAWPLVVGLHGRGAEPTSFARLFQRAGLAPGFIYACPRAPYLLAAGREPGWQWRDRFEDDSAGSASTWPSSADYVVDVVLNLRQRYPVSEVHLLGFSQGCGLAWRTGLTYPATFAGIVALGGWLDDDINDERLRAAAGLRFFIGHAEDDPVVGFDNATAARDRLAALGIPVTFHRFLGGHRIPPDLARACADWILGP
ncbi:alpha/beta fold hydrolase [candidate division WOR-3 bacterium]|nr:alpha/beta fold hydrolase [candidate division WOR-3 bacterium]